MRNLDKYSHIIYFLIPISIVIIPLVFGKYIFALDSIPKNHFDSFYGEIIPTYGGTLFFDFIYSTINFQKIIIFLILFLSGYSIWYLFRKISMSRASQLYASTLYIFNPYVYIRLISGHWPMLFSYAVLPFLVKTFIDILDKKEKKEIIKFVLLLSIIAFNIHILIISFIIMVIIFLFWFNKNRGIRILQIIILSIILFIFINLYWIFPLMTAKNTVIYNINDEDLKVYAPNIENISDIFNIASMYGFWKGGYIYAKDFIPYWQLLSVFMILLAIYGFISFYRDPKIGIYVVAFGVIGILGFILATGINGPFGGLDHWLFKNTILRGFRDSHKFVAMLALSYAILGGLGLSRFEAMSEKKKYLKAIIGIALIVPFIYSFTFFNGFAGQIKPTDYPADWYEVNDLLNQDSQDFKVLFFPWHSYMNFKWVNNTDKIIANPSKNFFDKEVIIGTNAGIGNIDRTAPDQLYIDSLLENRSDIKDFGKLASILNIKYVILAKERGSKEYDFLFDQKDMELISDTDTLYVFKNKNKVAKIYETNNIENIGYKVDIKYETINPVKFEIQESSRKYLVFTEPYSKDWKLDGKEPVKAYGVVNAFENGGKELRFERFYRVNLPAYVISMLTFIGLIAMYVGPRKAFK